MNVTDRLNTAEATRFLGCTERKLKELRRKRAVRFYRLGHRTVAYDADSLARYLKSREIVAIGDPR